MPICGFLWSKQNRRFGNILGNKLQFSLRLRPPDTGVMMRGRGPRKPLLPMTESKPDHPDPLQHPLDPEEAARKHRSCRRVKAKANER
jgi:hypothetical protein